MERKGMTPTDAALWLKLAVAVVELVTTLLQMHQHNAKRRRKKK